MTNPGPEDTRLELSIDDFKIIAYREEDPAPGPATVWLTRGGEDGQPAWVAILTPHEAIAIGIYLRRAAEFADPDEPAPAD